MLYKRHIGGFFIMKNKSNASLGIKSLIIGAFISVIVFTLITLIFTVICYNTGNPSKNLGIFALASLILSGALSSFSLSRAKSRFGFGNAVASAIIVAAILASVSIIVSGGIGGSLLMNVGCYVLTSLLFAFLGRGAGAKRKRRKHS